MKIYGNVTLSLGEQEFLNVLMEKFGISEIEAVEHIIKYKREQVVYYELQGNKALVDQLKKELGDLT